MARGKTAPEALGIDLVHWFQWEKRSVLKKNVFSPRAIIGSRILKSGNSIYKRSIRDVPM